MTRARLHIVWFLILAIACGKQAPENHANHTGHDSTKIVQSILQISRPANQVVLSTQKTIKPSQKLSDRVIMATGYIAFDERRNNIVAVRTSGRIEKLYIKYNYQSVKKGERIAELYSPELNTYQEEYLFLLRSGEESLAGKAKRKLELLELMESQIQQIEKSGAITHTITITSPIDGFVRFSSESGSAEEIEQSASSEMGEMGNTSASTTNASANPAGQIREGMYVNRGQTLFVVNDCRQVWVILSVNISAQVELKKGTAVTLYSDALSDSINANIDLVEPVFQDKQRFAQARIYLDNPERTFKINSFMKGKILIRGKGLTVPLSSVYDLGSRRIVWIKKGTTAGGVGLFEAQIVTTGMATNKLIEITSGLKGDEELALDAGYMLDSESILIEKQ